jgi:hypothetical protein
VGLLIVLAVSHHRVYASVAIDVHAREDKCTEVRIIFIFECHLFVADSTRELDIQNIVRIIVTSLQKCREEGFGDRHLGGEIERAAKKVLADVVAQLVRDEMLVRVCRCTEACLRA